MNNKKPMIVCVLCAVFVITGHVIAKPGYDLKRIGVEYRFQEQTAPRPNRVHVLRVDLAVGRVKPAAAIAVDPDGDGPAEAALTDPRKLAGDKRTVVFINTNPWDSFPDAGGKKNRNWYEGQPVDITGLAASGSQVRSRAGDGCVGIWVDHGGSVHMGDALPADDIVEGVAGWYQIVKDGVVIPQQSEALNPLTGIGVDRSGRILWLVVVDGRQPGYSEGMSHYELACLLRDLGCWHGALMDGGGSSIMGVLGSDGEMHVVNSPSDRFLGVSRVRPLPMVLTIRKSVEATPVSQGTIRGNP